MYCMHCMCVEYEMVYEWDGPLLRVEQQLGLAQLGVHDVFLAPEPTQLGLRRLQLEAHLVDRMRRLQQQQFNNGDHTTYNSMVTARSGCHSPGSRLPCAPSSTRPAPTPRRNTSSSVPIVCAIGKAPVVDTEPG